MRFPWPAVLLLSFLGGLSIADPGIPFMDAAERAAFVDYHNTLRSQIAKVTFKAKGGKQMPPAANMERMTWDSKLEASAQKYANTCPIGHSRWPDLGENLYWKYDFKPLSGTGGANEASKWWANEFQDFGWNTLEIGTQTEIWHATQMAWATTNRVGCGIAKCASSKFPGSKFELAIVCQYAPPGNYYGMPNYIAGATCSQCPAGTTCDKASGLCFGSGAPAPAPAVLTQPTPPVILPTRSATAIGQTTPAAPGSNRPAAPAGRPAGVAASRPTRQVTRTVTTRSTAANGTVTITTTTTTTNICEGSAGTQ